MKHFLLSFICIAAISGAVFYSVSVSHDRSGQASNGVLDLRSADLNENVFTLDGEWEFYWERLYTPEDFRNLEGLPEGGTFIPLPSPWNSVGYPTTGCGTYRLTLLCPSDGKLMLYVPEIFSSAVIWVNGRKIYSAGTVGADKDSAVSYAKNELVNLLVDNGVAEILVQVSNYGNIYGGIQHPFRIGLATTLPRSVFGRWLMLAGVAGAFFIIGLYHLALFLYRRTAGGNLVYFVFAACCILGGLRFLFDFDSIAQYFLRNFLNVHINFIYSVLTALHSIAIVFFALLVLEIKLKPRAKTAFTVMLGIPLASILLLPSPLSLFVAFLIIVSTLFMTCILAARSLSLARVRSRPYLGLYFISLVYFLLWGTIANSIAQTYFFAAFVLSTTFMMLSQFVMLSQDYAEARWKARELTARTGFYRRMSHDLLTPLTKVSTNVQTARRRPREADALLAKSQDEIMKMADMIGDALEQGDEGGTSS